MKLSASVTAAALFTVVVTTSGFAQQQKPPRAKPAATQQGGYCAKGYERCVLDGIKLGYSAPDAGGFCTRQCAGG
jgi:hypothetical protein